MGRVAIVLMAVVGTLPLLAGPTALDATTISGTMVVGLVSSAAAAQNHSRADPLTMRAHCNDAPFRCPSVVVRGPVLQMTCKT